jgi:hypothetical protein
MVLNLSLIGLSCELLREIERFFRSYYDFFDYFFCAVVPAWSRIGILCGPKEAPNGP